MNKKQLIEKPVEPEESATEEEWLSYYSELIDYEDRTKESLFLRWWLLVGGIIGLISASILVLEKLSYWEQKAEGRLPALSCNLNPIVGCGPVINTDQASIFWNIPNPLLGVVAWSIIIVLGVLLLSRVKLANWHYIGLQLGSFFGIGIVSYLQYQSIYNLHALCPYCMVTWAVTIVTFWVVTGTNLKRWFYDSFLAKVVYRWLWAFMVVHFAVILMAIWFKFGDAIFA